MRGLVAVLGIAALSCTDPPPRPTRAAVRDAAAEPRRAADGGAAPTVTDAAIAARPDAAAARPVPGASDGGAAPAATLVVACRPASAPSWPAVAWLGDASAVATYDGDRTRLVRVPERAGQARELTRMTIDPSGGAATAAPGLAAGRTGGLLATIEGPAPTHRLFVHLVDGTLAPSGPPRPIASSVDPRYGPAVVPFGPGWLIGWIDASGELGRALVCALGADGAPRGEPQVLSESPTGAASLALARHGEQAVAAWIDPHLGFSPISVAWSDAEGRFGAPRIVATTGSVDRAAMVAVAAGANESGLVVWGHVGGLGQDFLSQSLLPLAGALSRPRALSRIDAYATLRAVALPGADGGWGVAWDSPTTTGRAPPTAVKLQWLDATGAPEGAPLDLGMGGGVTAASDAPHLVLAFRRGMSVCIAEPAGDPP